MSVFRFARSDGNRVARIPKPRIPLGKIVLRFSDYSLNRISLTRRASAERSEWGGYEHRVRWDTAPVSSFCQGQSLIGRGKWPSAKGPDATVRITAKSASHQLSLLFTRSLG